MAKQHCLGLLKLNILIILYSVLVYDISAFDLVTESLPVTFQNLYALDQTKFSKNIENDWKPNMRKEIIAETLSQCSIFCTRAKDEVITLEFPSFTKTYAQNIFKFYFAV